MTREILFRAKRVDSGEWVEGYYSKCKDQNYIEYEYNGVLTSFTVTPESVGQFTGLLDKNKKKIFEGDVLTHLDKYGKITVTVRYFWNRFVFNSEELGDLNTNMSELFEIIGNIHDNPAL